VESKHSYVQCAIIAGGGKTGMEGIKWDIIGIGEVKKRGEQFGELKSGHHLYHIGMKEKK